MDFVIVFSYGLECTSIIVAGISSSIDCDRDSAWICTSGRAGRLYTAEEGCF